MNPYNVIWRKVRKCAHGLKSLLILEDGLVVEGCGFGYPTTRVGELVFTTGMVGYPEALTDPSFRGQILVLTHPLIGNYGVPSSNILEYGIPKFFESERIQVEALVVAYDTSPSHWTSIMSLHEWLSREGVPGLSGIDTRMLVRRIRERGVMMAIAAVYDERDDVNVDELVTKLSSSTRYDYRDLVSEVSPKNIIFHEPTEYSHSIPTIIVVDCGIKYGILRELLRRGFRVIRIPCYEDPVKYLYEFKASGIVISNGPGNPLLLKDVIRHAAGVIEYGIPTLGICLGHQVLALAAGANVFKLKYGHRGHNKPCLDVERGKCFVTSQNHGYAIDRDSLSNTQFKLWFVNVDDKTTEGLRHTSKPIITTQFHPEASPGPLDSVWVFNLFKRLVERYGATV